MFNLYKYLSQEEKIANKIGVFRILLAIFGGLLGAYLGMTLLAIVLPDKIKYTAVLSIMLNTFAWALYIIWISLAPTKLSAIFRFLIPTMIFSISLYILY